MQGRDRGHLGKERPHLEFMAFLLLCSISICSFLTISSVLAAPHSIFIPSTESFVYVQMCDGGGLPVIYFVCLVGMITINCGKF